MDDSKQVQEHDVKVVDILIIDRYLYFSYVSVSFEWGVGLGSSTLNQSTICPHVSNESMWRICFTRLNLCHNFTTDKFTIDSIYKTHNELHWSNGIPYNFFYVGTDHRSCHLASNCKS